MKKIYTRTDYLNGDCDFDTYYGQFLTPALVGAVGKIFGKRLLKSVDRYFNDIPLAQWDDFQVQDMIDGPTWKAANGGQFFWSLSDNVCLAKTAARRWLSSKNANDDHSR